MGQREKVINEANLYGIVQHEVCYTAENVDCSHDVDRDMGVST